VNLVVFDVNETLLDLSPMKRVFEEMFGTADVLGEWFARLLHGSLVANHLDRYRPFSEIAVEQLLALARRRGVDLGEAEAREVVSHMRNLPPHPDVVPALESLTRTGHRLATLTNNPQEALDAQLANAGIAGFFEATLTVEPVAKFKPAPEPYLYAARTLGVEPGSMWMVAAHDWDVAGAVAAGTRAVFVARAPWTLPDPPPVVVDDLTGLPEVLVDE
jgi:2-haloacid dehalogenase